MKFLKNKIFFSLCFVFIFCSSCLRIDETIKTFFPKELSGLQSMQSDFSAFWWNFIVLDTDEVNTAKANSLCANLKLSLGKELRLVVCGQNNQIPYDLLRSWSADFFKREKFDAQKISEYQTQMNSALAVAAYSSDKKFFDFLRSDPFQTWKVFKDQITKQSADQFIYKNGFLYTTDLKKIVIPVQFMLKPSQVVTAPIIKLVQESGTNSLLIGIHGSSYRNEFQVKDDLKTVSAITLVVFILFLGFLVFRAGFLVLWLAVPVSISVFIAAKIVEIIYGDIHGLTLSFGSGIIGLALDYGLHGLMGQSSSQTWKSNFIGMATTLCGVLILIFSGIPLIQQMMVFSSIGLVVAFVMYYLIFKYFSKYFKVINLKLSTPTFKYSFVIMILLFIFGFFGIKNIQMNLDLKKLSFMTDKELEYSRVVFEKPTEVNEAYLIITDVSKTDFYAKKYAEKSKSENVTYQGVDLYLPQTEQQQSNLNSWVSSGCDQLNNKLSNEQKNFFGPYFKEHCTLQNNTQNSASTTYTEHLTSGQNVLSLLQPTTKKQVEYIEKEFPEAKSIVKSLHQFSVILQTDLQWMIPVALLLTFIILFLYYQSIIPVFMALFPFLTGMSLFFSVSYFLKIEIDLIAVLGLVMVFGFSIDYGVFSTDAHFHNLGCDDIDSEEVDNVYTALSLAAVTNSLGFLPMVFVLHPVLKQLGYALFFGTLGAYFGTMYGVKPYFLNRKKKYDSKK